MEILATALAFLMALVSLVGGVVIIVVIVQQRTKKLEMQHRERMAMIERWLMPSPETDPAGFEAVAGRPRAAPRYISLGVAVIGIGMALMLIIGFAGGEPAAALGVGGAVVMLGAAFLVNALLQRGYRPAPPSGTSWPPGSSPRPPLGPSDPPGPVGP